MPTITALAFGTVHFLQGRTRRMEIIAGNNHKSVLAGFGQKKIPLAEQHSDATKAMPFLIILLKNILPLKVEAPVSHYGWQRVYVL